MTTSDIGILITNIGSPEELTQKSVRTYLKKFLSDPRVVELPKLIWWPILRGFILPLRSRSSLHLYQQIWTDNGSPLTFYSKEILKKLSGAIDYPIALGMHYGKPSIEEALLELKEKNPKKIVILPLFPQYSATTTASTFDQVTQILKRFREIPSIQTIHHYWDHPDYIEALCKTIQSKPIEHLLFSFHGIPERYVKKGDPYPHQCKETVKLITQKLGLKPEQWSLSFQSRFGKAKWLGPYTAQLLTSLPQKGIKNLHVCCPGFAVDCLETLEEIAIRGRKQFLSAGGHSFELIPALNASDDHIRLLKNLINSGKNKL